MSAQLGAASSQLTLTDVPPRPGPHRIRRTMVRLLAPCPSHTVSCADADKHRQPTSFFTQRLHMREFSSCHRIAFVSLPFRICAFAIHIPDARYSSLAAAGNFQGTQHVEPGVLKHHGSAMQSFYFCQLNSLLSDPMSNVLCLRQVLVLILASLQ